MLVQATIYYILSSSFKFHTKEISALFIKDFRQLEMSRRKLLYHMIYRYLYICMHDDENELKDIEDFSPRFITYDYYFFPSNSKTLEIVVLVLVLLNLFSYFSEINLRKIYIYIHVHAFCRVFSRVFFE